MEQDADAIEEDADAAMPDEALADQGVQVQRDNERNARECF